MLFSSKINIPYKEMAMLKSMDIVEISSTGKIMLPPMVKKHFKLNQGDRLSVSVKNDAIILKRSSKASRNKLGSLIKNLRKQANAVGLTPSDLEEIYQSARHE